MWQAENLEFYLKRNGSGGETWAPDAQIMIRLLKLFLFWINVLQAHKTGVSRDQVENTITLLAEHNFANETWKAEILLIQPLNDGDGVVRPKISHEFSSNMNIRVGADVFYGDPDGLCGQFDEQDRITVGFEWGF